ncbi:MAG TPA: PAS domain-containing protein [Dongiaceae bacterium]
MDDQFRILSTAELDRFTCRSRTVETLLAYWHAKQREAGQRRTSLPRRANIDPADLKSILPQVMLVDLSYQPFRARYRLVGTGVVEHTKLDFTNFYADDILFQDGDGTDWTDCYRQVAEVRRPGFGISHWMPHQDFFQWTEFLICPLSEDDSQVSQCISAEEYEKLPDHLADIFRARPLT